MEPRDRLSVPGFLAQFSTPQLVLLGLAAATWLVGGNILIAFHYRRLGKSGWSGFHPFAFPFKDFNAREWLILLVLAALTFAFGITAMSMNPVGR